LANSVRCRCPRSKFAYYSHIPCQNLQIVSGNSRPQNQAIAAAIKKEVNAEYDLLPGSTGVPEGNADSGWIVLDYGGIMVNVMTPKSRLYYNVEGQWQDKVRISTKTVPLLFASFFSFFDFCS
jgi:ribosome-associated protein